MSNFDDLFRQEQGQTTPISGQPFDKEPGRKAGAAGSGMRPIDETAAAVAETAMLFKYLDV